MSTMGFAGRIKLECEIHGQHEAVMYMKMNTPNFERNEAVAICMFCLQEQLEKLGVKRMKIVTEKPS